MKFCARACLFLLLTKFRVVADKKANVFQKVGCNLIERDALKTSVAQDRSAISSQKAVKSL